MMKIGGYLLALIILLGIAFLLYTYAPRAPLLGTNTATTTETTADGTEMKTEVIATSTATYRIEIRYPQFAIPVVDAKIKAVVDRAITEFKKYPANPADSSVSQNELTGSFDSTYAGPDIVSVELSISEYTGGAHPNTALIGVNVDRTTGKELTLDDALALIGKTLPQVAESSIEELKRQFGGDLAFPEGADPKPENYSTFVVSKDKVTFIFNNYQVAPYAAGHQEVWFKRMK